MGLLYIDDKEAWERKIIATPNHLATAKEKIIALRLPEIEEWFNEQATEDTDYSSTDSTIVRISPTAICRQTGLSRTTVYRVLVLWASEGLILRKVQHYLGGDNQFRTRVYIECSERFLQGDIAVARPEKVKKERGVKKGTTFTRCPDCDRPLRRVYRCEAGHSWEHSELVYMRQESETSERDDTLFL